MSPSPIDDDLMDVLTPTTMLPAVAADHTFVDGRVDTQEFDGGGLGDDGFEDEEDFLPPPRRRVGRLTVLLVAGLVAGLAFLGGVLLQKHEAPSTGGGANASRAAARSLFGGTGTGGFGGFGGAGGATGGAGAGAGTGTGGTGSATTAPPVAVGKVTSVSGRTVTLENLGGKSVTIQLTATTTVTSTGTAALAPGATIAVTGTVAADGTVTAATVKQTG